MTGGSATEKSIDKYPCYVAMIRDQKAVRVQPLSFIHSLSDDLLFEIFSIFITHSHYTMARSSAPAPVTLSMICRRWRDIVKYSPLLWTDIFFPTNPKYDTLVFFERSYPAPINVSFDSVSYQLHDHTALLRFSQALKKHISRVRSLTINVRGKTDMRDFWDTLESLEALHLQTLSVRLCRSTCDTTVDYNTVATHTPLWQGDGLVHSVRIVGLCFRCLPLLVGLTKLEIGHVELNSRDLQALLNTYPSLSTLVIARFGAAIQDIGTPLPDQTPHPAQVFAPSLRSLAVHIDDSHSSECTCALPWFMMDKLEYLEIMFPFYTAHHASILTRFKSVPLLRKIRIYGLLDFSTFDNTLLTSLPKSTDLEFVYYPEAGGPALTEILALPYFHSITFGLASRGRSLGHLLGVEEFCLAISPIEPKSHVIIHLPNTDISQKLRTVKAVLGDKLSIHTFPIEKGLLDDFLPTHFSLFDYGENEDDPEDLAYGFEDELEEDEDEPGDLAYEFEGEFEDAFQGELQDLYPSDWDVDWDVYYGDDDSVDGEDLSVAGDFY